MNPQQLESQYPPDARYEEISKILGYIKSGNSVQIISLIGVGRSNVLRILAYNRAARELHLKENADKFHFVMMNFSEIKKRPLSDSTKYILIEILESLSLRKLEEEHKFAKDLFDDALKTGDEMVIFQALKKTVDYLSIEKDMNLVLLFDRFEEYVGVLEPVFFDNLRVLRDRAKYKFSAVFPLNRPLEETLGHEILSSFYEFVVGNHVYLSLGDEKIREFRLSYLKKTTGKNIDNELLEEITRITGGLGKLWLVSVETSLNEGIKDAEELIKYPKIKAVLGEIWKSLTPFEQNLIANGKATDSAHLVAVGLVKNNKFAVPMLEEYAKKEAKSLIEKITYDSANNEIKKGNILLSEGLTSSEFKLLKFMVQNPERVLERDEVVNSVWGDLSSTAGVSEQALDQLVFRVRKKIEENPNQPIHIQTVKGRGFKFAA